MELTNADFLPEPTSRVHMPVRFEWIEEGAFLALRQGEKGVSPAWAIWVIARDENEKDFRVQYYDNRKVSRIYQMSFDGRVWKIWREAPGFYQRFEGRISKDGKKIEAEWQKSMDGKTWEHDFDLIYTRK